MQYLLLCCIFCSFILNSAVNKMLWELSVLYPGFTVTYVPFGRHIWLHHASAVIHIHNTVCDARRVANFFNFVSRTVNSYKFLQVSGRHICIHATTSHSVSSTAKTVSQEIVIVIVTFLTHLEKLVKGYFKLRIHKHVKRYFKLRTQACGKIFETKNTF